MSNSGTFISINFSSVRSNENSCHSHVKQPTAKFRRNQLQHSESVSLGNCYYFVVTYEFSAVVVSVGEVSLCKCSGVLEINKNSKNMKNTAANEEIQQNRRKAFGAEVRTSYLLQIFSLI